MRKQMGSPAVFSALLAALAVTGLPSGSASAADDCIAAPNSQPPEGSHWYYRMDRAKQRKCWYVGPQGQKVHRVVPHPAARSFTPPAAERPSTPIQAATAAGATVPAGVQRAAKDAAQEIPSATSLVAQWPDALQPPVPIERAEAAASAFAPPLRMMQVPQDAAAQERVLEQPATQKSATTIGQAAVAPDQAEAPLPVAAAAAMGDLAAITPVRLLMLLVSAGILSGVIFRIAARRRPYVDHRDANRSAGTAHERTAPAFAVQRTRDLGQAPIGRTDLHHDAEHALRQFLRGLTDGSVHMERASYARSASDASRANRACV